MCYKTFHGAWLQLRHCFKHSCIREEDVRLCCFFQRWIWQKKKMHSCNYKLPHHKLIFPWSCSWTLCECFLFFSMYQNICWGHQSLQSQLIKLIIRVKAAILQSVSKQLSVLWCWDAKTHIFTFACITCVNVCFRDKEKKEGEEETCSLNSALLTSERRKVGPSHLIRISF